jgi:hypothetical protein
MYKDFNKRLTKLQERAGLSNPRNKLRKLLQDIDNLEKFYTDREYRNKLESAIFTMVPTEYKLYDRCI